MEARAPAFDFETAFHAHYGRIARVIARVIRDPGRAEELAVEVLWKFWKTPDAHGQQAGGWLYRTAVRIGLNELRRRVRGSRHESLAGDAHGLPGAPNPEEVRAAREEQEHVRLVLDALDSRQAELLLLRSSGLSYDEVASALDRNPASIGTLLSRAQQAFRKEYIKRYGEQ